jgi:hypothetical protein
MRHAHERDTHESHPYEMHAHDTHAYEMHVYETNAMRYTPKGCTLMTYTLMRYIPIDSLVLRHSQVLSSSSLATNIAILAFVLVVA